MIKEIFDGLNKIHIFLKHEVKDRMLYKINKCYTNITRTDVEKHLNLCT